MTRWGVGFTIPSSPSLSLPPMGACPADTLEGRSPGLAVFVTQNAPSCSLPSPAALREPGARHCPRAEHVSEPSRGPVSQPRSCPRLPALGRGRGAIFRGVRLEPLLLRPAHGAWPAQTYLLARGLFVGLFLCVGVEMTFSLSALTDACSSL